jgi:hypothetical protein
MLASAAPIFAWALLRGRAGRNGIRAASHRRKPAVSRGFSDISSLAWHLQFDRREPPTKGKPAMLKKIVLALALTTFASTSAFAAKAAKTTKPTVTHTLAQTGEAKPAEAKPVKKEKKAKKDAKVAPAPTAAAPAEPAAPAAPAAPASAPAPAPAKK